MLESGPEITVFLAFLLSGGCVDKGISQRRESSPVDRRAIQGIWWWPDMYQSAAFRIKDSTIYYPDMFEEFRYKLKGEI